MKIKKPGESFRPLVTIVKSKNGVPTVITLSGQVYVLRHESQYRGGGGQR